MAGNLAQLPLLVSILVSSSVISFWLGLRRRSQVRELLDRLSAVGNRQSIPEELEMQQPFMTRVVRPALRAWVRRLGQIMPHRNVDRLQLNLERAGQPNDMTVSDFLGVRLIIGIAVTVIFAALLFMREKGILQVVLLGLGAGVGGSLIPNFWLRRKARERRDEIRRGMPDALDMLSIAVSAGLGLDGAMQTISEKWDNAVSDEFGQAVRETQIGVPRAEALRGMARRAGVKEMSHFIAVLVQADQLGLSISTVLKTQSDQMRLMRRQRAEELANAAPIKMLFPLVLLIFPAMFVVILGPAIPRMLELFKHL
ncbi:MAG: type II secretion system F family protein [Anaerolineae bacterium]